MKTFYIFKLNRDMYRIAKITPYNVYVLLNTIYRQNRKDLIKAFNLFNEICLPINYNFFNEYIYDKLGTNEFYTKFKSTHMYYNYFSGESSKMIVNKSFILIKSNTNNNIFINNINNLYGFFICNFKDDFYTFINKKKEYKKIKVK